LGIYDTCGVHNLHGIPGVLGGIVSAIAAAAYNLSSTVDAYVITNNDFPYYDALVSKPYKQGGIQIAATFISIGIGMVTALIASSIIRCFYSYHPN
jgi:ammonium transporter Rh